MIKANNRSNKLDIYYHGKPKGLMPYREIQKYLSKGKKLITFDTDNEIGFIPLGFKTNIK